MSVSVQTTSVKDVVVIAVLQIIINYKGNMISVRIRIGAAKAMTKVMAKN